jgi:carboxyl-terminal processing protease
MGNKNVSNEGAAKSETVPKNRAPYLLKRFGFVLVAVLIFWAGVGFGSGRLRLTSGGGQNQNLPSRLDYSSVDEVYQVLKDNYDGKLTEAQLLNGMKAGLADATKDPYTEFFTPVEAKNFQSQLNNSFSGIGAELGKDKNGNIQIVAPIPGFPADKAGIKAQDLIATINGKSTSGMSVEQAVSLIRGKSGTPVTLGIVRGGSQTLKITITRQTITVPSVSHQILDGNIGYIRITTFADDTSNLIDSTATQLKQAGVKGIVLDLRDNPGGLLSAAVHVSSKWLPQDTLILQEKRGSIVTDTYKAEGGDTLNAIPTVVLVNAGSASASEITAGALHDNKAATIMGEKSYGKGVVQQLIDLRDGAQLKVTIASWYRPNGQNINHRGITPDKKVTENNNATPDNDAQKTAAINFLLGK